MSPSFPLRILLVEDNPESRDAALDDITRVLPAAEVEWVGDMEAALGALSTNKFDLAVCDLRIPARAGELSASEVNGQNVISTILSEHGGTPVLVLSAYADLENTGRLITNAPVVSAFGVRRLPMCQVVVKAKTDDFASRMKGLADGLSGLESIDLQSAVKIHPLVERAVRHLAYKHEYLRAQVDRASGLSGSQNAIITLHGESRPIMRAFVKVDDRRWIIEENERRSQYVEGYLDPGHWAATLEVLDVGMLGMAASFSSLASESTSLFQSLGAEPDLGRRAIQNLERVLVPWRVSGVPVRTSVCQLRRAHIDDDRAIELGVDFSMLGDIERKPITYRQSVVHGDLHGENLLVLGESNPLLIDFAYTGLGPAVTDPVTLEMSLFFHPESPLDEGALARVDYSAWASGNCLVGTPFQAVVEQCRAWALRDQTEDEFFAFAYAHALRQLKHPNVDRTRALAVAMSAAKALQDGG